MRALTSAFIVVLLSAMVLSAMPDSRLTELAEPVRQPITDVTGLFQSWDLFAPEPRWHTVQLEARLTYADGTVDRWSPPAEGLLVAPYRNYRWRKWAMSVLDDQNEFLRGPAARFVAAHQLRDGRPPVRVVLTKLTYDAPPPGSGLPRDPDPWWQREDFYTLDLAGVAG